MPIRTASFLIAGGCVQASRRGGFAEWVHENVTQLTDDVLRFVTQVNDSKAFRV